MLLEAYARKLSAETDNNDNLEDTKEEDLEEFLASRVGFKDHSQIENIFKRRLYLEGQKTR